MKCIEKAMRETEFLPRAKWWGFVRENKRYLMRYHHCFAVFDLTTGEVLSATYETVTDKRGVEAALRIWTSLNEKS